MRTYLTTHGVPADRIVTDRAGLDTYDSCARALRIFGVGDVVIVSQGYHLPRAVGTARRLGLRAVGVGDETARWRSYPWWRGVLRDQVACVKTVWDLASRRDPVLGPPDDRVQRALQDG
jgi:vancomycin permeability regulator SanA